jgi:hypothetical protein
MDRKRGIGLCICRMCPSFVDCNEEIAFCLADTTKSICITKEQGCLCPGCPVQEEENFQYVFYCTRGSQTGQSQAR